MLENLGYARAGSPDEGSCKGQSAAELPVAELRAEADIIVVNTCSVRENADNKFFGVLGQIKKAKESGPAKIVAVCGCMMQQESIRSEIQRAFPWVDIVFGTQNIAELPELLSRVCARDGQGGARVSAADRAWHVIDDMPDIIEGLPAKREYPFKAFVNIIYGCNNFCTYCIVPYTRGREKSRTPEALCAEVTELCAGGVKEITLLGQNVNSYRGISEDGTEYDFPDLIRRLSRADGLERIRFMTSHPKDLSDKLIALYAELPNLCPAIHLPVQSGSTDVLRRMNRKYRQEDYLTLVTKLRDVNPDIVITTDLIVGFPGETDADFEATMDVIERVRFDSAFTFLYSPRTGTPAAAYNEQVPEIIKHKRFERMVERLNAIALEKNSLYVGRTERVLVESESKTRRDMLSGRTPGGKLVNLPAPADGGGKLIGRIVPVRITAANTFSFTGEVVE
jgi:tRNA-2-methylthio-N6-dimethylallyladenosine synthase